MEEVLDQKPFRPEQVHQSNTDRSLVMKALKLCDQHQGSSSLPVGVGSEMQNSQQLETWKSIAVENVCKNEIGFAGNLLTGVSFAAERERRMHLTKLYQSLLDLIPYPGPLKRDRGSILGYAIRYIKELLSTVSKLEQQVEETKLAPEKSKRQGAEDDAACAADKPPHSCYESLSKDFCERKLKDRDVYVWITGDDELTVKLIQRNKTNVLLFAVKVLGELRLEPHRVTGGQSDDHDQSSFTFSIKIKQGFSTHACAIASRLIDTEARVIPATPCCRL